MGNQLTTQIQASQSHARQKRNSLPASSLVARRPSVDPPLPPSSRLSWTHLPAQNEEGEEEPIDDKFSSRLKDIDGGVKSSRDKGLNTIGMDKLNVGFVGFRGSGRSTLIRSILGCPHSLNQKGETIIDKRRTFMKSRSVHFSEKISSQLVPFYFRHLTSIVLWEISYPFDATLREDQERGRDERLHNFFLDQHLANFCLLFVCVDGDDLREEDIAFARTIRQHGKEVVFLKTKSDSLMSSISSQEEASSLLAQEKIIFESKLAERAGDLADTKTFFVSSRAIPTLIAQSKDARIVAFRKLELLPSTITQSLILEGRRHTMEGSIAERTEPRDAIKLEEEDLMRYILNQLDELPLNGRSL